jgi:hypothetical protein
MSAAVLICRCRLHVTHPSIAKAKVESQKLGPVEKKTCATMPSDLPFHSVRISIDFLTQRMEAYRIDRKQ